MKKIGVMKMTKKMNGKIEEGSGLVPGSFTDLYMKQLRFQNVIVEEQLPVDSVKHFSYHMQAMMEELGEVLRADKRWKTHRNTFHDPVNKAEELADVFITAFNLAIFSGIKPEEMFKAIEDKIYKNYERKGIVK